MHSKPEAKKPWHAIAKDQTLKQGQVNQLDDMSVYITQKDGTERPFQNEFWDCKDEGLYVDIVSGEPLFLSSDKFDSGTGWPSFTKPISKDYITTKQDHKLGHSRTEVRSKYGNSHLGHVFPDGPREHGGQRYCINSGALRFIKKESLATTQGYEEFLKYFSP